MNVNTLSIEPSSFCELLRGSLALPNKEDAGLILLIEGKPGTGKSTLALQLLDTIDYQGTRGRLLYSVEQSAEDVRQKYFKEIAAKLVAIAREKSNDGKSTDACMLQLLVDRCEGRSPPTSKTHLGRAKILTDIDSCLADSGAREDSRRDVLKAVSDLLASRLKLDEDPHTDDSSFLQAKSKVEQSLQTIVRKLVESKDSPKRRDQRHRRRRRPEPVLPNGAGSHRLSAVGGCPARKERGRDHGLRAWFGRRRLPRAPGRHDDPTGRAMDRKAAVLPSS